MRIKIIAWKISDERTTPCPDIRSDVNSSRICSITFPTQSRYAFAELTRWMRPGERRTNGTKRACMNGEQGRKIKSEKDVFRSEIVCWLSTSSLTSQRGRRAAKRQRGCARWTLPRPETPAREIAPYRNHL